MISVSNFGYFFDIRLIISGISVISALNDIGKDLERIAGVITSPKN